MTHPQNPSMSDLLADLLSRVRAATGRDRKIDAAIFAMAGIDEAHCLSWCSMDGRTDITRDMYVSAWAPCYTTSVDACIKLAERVLPGWIWKLDSGSPAMAEPPFAYVAIDAPRDVTGRSLGATPALAMLAAIIVALIALRRKDKP